MTDKEPERYYDWMLWKNRQEEARYNLIKQDSPFVQYGKDEHEVYLDLDAYRSLGNVPEEGDLSRIEYKYNENQLIAEFKEYVDETYGLHYSKEKFQATEFIMDGGHGTGFCIGNVLKYAQRYGKKGTRADARKDLMKVLHYALLQLHVHDSEDKK